MEGSGGGVTGAMISRSSIRVRHGAGIRKTIVVRGYGIDITLNGKGVEKEGRTLLLGALVLLVLVIFLRRFNYTGCARGLRDAEVEATRRRVCRLFKGEVNAALFAFLLPIISLLFFMLLTGIDSMRIGRGDFNRILQVDIYKGFGALQKSTNPAAFGCCSGRLLRLIVGRRISDAGVKNEGSGCTAAQQSVKRPHRTCLVFQQR